MVTPRIRCENDFGPEHAFRGSGSQAPALFFLLPFFASITCEIRGSALQQPRITNYRALRIAF